ncbi:phosphoribosyl-ATP pyrophosphohydrolase [Deinococcus sp.]|uniref:phosphoribosyl-ATP pyrophosphohydrolase n=1 Tax=Deinococcus sp. TaxID=47478 RepID=UPI003B5C85A2
MSKTTTAKLVRDHIPDLIRARGQTCEVSQLSVAQYRAALRAKLKEEAQEVAETELSELISELGDVLEVIDALLKAEGLTWTEVQAAQTRKRAERGGFEKRLMLLSIS